MYSAVQKYLDREIHREFSPYQVNPTAMHMSINNKMLYIILLYEVYIYSCMCVFVIQFWDTFFFLGTHNLVQSACIMHYTGENPAVHTLTPT